MKTLTLAALSLLLVAGPAQADSCDTLIQSVEQALQSQAATPAQKSNLESILRAARSAKTQGNIEACQNALQSDRPAGTPGRGSDCEKTPDTV